MPAFRSVVSVLLRELMPPNSGKSGGVLAGGSAAGRQLSSRHQAGEPSGQTSHRGHPAPSSQGDFSLHPQGRPAGGLRPPSAGGAAMRSERDRARARSLPDAATAAVTSMAVSRPAPIAHHQKKTNTDAISRPSPSPTPKAPALAARGRRLSAASNRSRRCQRPPTRSASPPSSGTRATTSIRANPCPGLIGTSTGPSKRAGTANSTKARANRIPQPCSHFIALPLSQLLSRLGPMTLSSSFILPT